MKQTSIPTNASEQKFDRGTGTGEPTGEGMGQLFHGHNQKLGSPQS
jgi:hypothetical protein